MATTTTTTTATTTTTYLVNSNSSEAPVSTSKKGMNFEELRNKNWDSIDKYYQKIITDFRNKSQQLTTSIGDADQAQYVRYLQPEVNDYQNQIVNILQEMMNLLDKNDDIIREQKNVVDKLEKDNDNLIQSIASLKDKKTLEKTESKGHEDNQNLIEDDLSTLKRWNLYSKIAIGIFATVIVLLFVYRIWLELSSSLSTVTNTRNTLNTLPLTSTNTPTPIPSKNNTSVKNSTTNSNNTIPKQNTTTRSNV